VCASIAMGGIAIWCMHYIGNRAIVLGPDSQLSQLQISYNSSYTAASFFVPIIVLLGAFAVAGANENVGTLRIVSGGILAGLAICGMHYLGQTGISNYSCSYEPGHVVGAAIIAVFASVTALTVFFILRAAWTNVWWKRALCAILLAGAVSGMHWTAAVGTYYKFKGSSGNSMSENLTRDQTVIVVIVFVSPLSPLQRSAPSQKHYMPNYSIEAITSVRLVNFSD
jgi:NO-binding membrane sensor protein with MHYT domain